MSLRRALYKAAALLGDLNALRRGPHAVLMRLVRRYVWGAVSRILNRWLR